MTSCRQRIMALLAAVIFLIAFLGNLPTVHANNDSRVKQYCGLAFSYAVVTACAEAKRSIRSAPFYDLFPAFKSQERIPDDFDDSTVFHVRKRQDYQGMATYCCSNGCSLSQLANSGIC